MEMEIFCKVKDPRVLGKVRHELEDVLRMALIGVLCDCEDCDDISDMVTDREEEFRASGLLKLTNGVPCGDTILHVVESVKPARLRASLDCCRGHIMESLCGHQVVIDGKKLRGENPMSLGCHGLYILNAWVSETEICVAEKPVDAKANELFRRYCPRCGSRAPWSQSMPWASTAASRNRLYCRAVITLWPLKTISPCSRT